MKSIILAFFAFTALTATAEQIPPIYSQQCIVREGLPNFFVKAESGQDVKVAYFGGSITAQPGYRLQTFGWFEQQWQQANFIEINAAIGGTGSELGAFRIGGDVLKYEPDLVFIEFAVNDYGLGKNSPERVSLAVEGIVRQILQNNPHTDICFVYTLTEATLKDIKEGNYPGSTLAHEQVAAYYGLPSINMASEVIELEKQGKLIMRGDGGSFAALSKEQLLAPMPLNDQWQIIFAKDGVHPYTNSGHIFYSQAVKNSFEKFLEAGEPQSRTLKPPMNPENLENAKMVSIADFLFGDGWYEHQWDNERLPVSIRKFMPDVTYTCLKGDSIEFRFKGRAFGLYDVIGPTAGNAVCFVDGEQIADVRRFDRYCNYYRISSFMRYLDEEGEYEIKIELGEGLSIDQKAELLAQREIEIEEPSAYKENCLYVGRIMLIGDIVEKEIEVEIQ